MSKSSARASSGSRGKAAAERTADAEAEAIVEQAAKAQDLIETLFPDSKPGADAEFKNRRWLVRFKQAAMDHQLSAASLADRLTKAVDDQFKADNKDRARRTDADIRDRDERRQGEEARAERRLEQELSERRTEQRDRSRERNLFMVLTAAGFIATIVFSFLAIRYVQPWGFTGVGTGLLLSGGGIFKLRLLDLAEQRRDTTIEKTVLN